MESLLRGETKDTIFGHDEFNNSTLEPAKKISAAPARDLAAAIARGVPFKKELFPFGDSLMDKEKAFMGFKLDFDKLDLGRRLGFFKASARVEAGARAGAGASPTPSLYDD